MHIYEINICEVMVIRLYQSEYILSDPKQIEKSVRLTDEPGFEAAEVNKVNGIFLWRRNQGAKIKLF